MLLSATLTGTAHAAVELEISGTVGSLLTGVDHDGLAGATIVLSTTILDGTYEARFGILPFAPGTDSTATVSGASAPGVDGTYDLGALFAGQMEPYGFFPWFPEIVDSSFFFPAFELANGHIVTVAHGTLATATGGAAMEGSPIQFSDFPVGPAAFPSFTVAVHPNAVDPVIAQFSDTTPTYTPTEVGGVVIPEPSTLAIWAGLDGIGLAVGPWRRRRRK
jgi:hypothetical protein